MDFDPKKTLQNDEAEDVQVPLPREYLPFIALPRSSQSISLPPIENPHDAQFTHDRLILGMEEIFSAYGNAEYSLLHYSARAGPVSFGAMSC